MPELSRDFRHGCKKMPFLIFKFVKISQKLEQKDHFYYCIHMPVADEWRTSKIVALIDPRRNGAPEGGRANLLRVRPGVCGAAPAAQSHASEAPQRPRVLHLRILQKGTELAHCTTLFYTKKQQSWSQDLDLEQIFFLLKRRILLRIKIFSPMLLLKLEIRIILFLNIDTYK